MDRARGIQSVSSSRALKDPPAAHATYLVSSYLSNSVVPVSHYNGNSDVPKVTNSLYLLDHLSEEDDGDFEGTWSDTTTPTSQHPVPHGWSDVTLTGSVMDRSSYASWEENEGVLDRVSGEQVGLMFDAVDQSLYDGYSTGFNQMDWECLEWKNKFPHLRVKGIHLLDSLEDGTEIVDPVSVENEEISDTQLTDSSCSLIVVGHRIKMQPPPSLFIGKDLDEHPGLHYEENLASHGLVEEYFAYNCSSSAPDDKTNQMSRPSQLPPISPTDCLIDTVFTLIFDQLWSQVALTLHPLLMKYNRINYKITSMSRHSLLPFQNHVPVYDLYLPSHGVPVTKGGQSGLQVNKRRPIPAGLGSTQTMDLPSLQKVMTIKPVSLQQRIPSSTFPSVLNPMFQPSVDSSESLVFPDFSSRVLQSSRQMSFLQTPVPPKGSEQKITSGKISKRNHLKPLEVPHTPGLILIEEDLKEFGGLRGQRLVRHTQLPPLDPSQFGNSESLQTRGHVAFSNRIASATTDTREYFDSMNQRNAVPGMNSDPRPSTSQTLPRSETPSIRKASSGLSIPPIPSSIQVVGYAANLHSDSVLWEEQEDESNEFTSHKSKTSHSRTRTSYGPR